MCAAGSVPHGSGLTRSEEDYLSDLYRLGGQGPVRTGDIAQRLGVTPASASGMLKRLSREGLVNYREYGGATLTADGERAALGVVRRHRVVERFLTDLLQFGWEQVDALAHQMEHALPDVVVDAIERLLGDPATCPHGFPIPGKDGRVAHEPQLSIRGLKPGERAQVREVDEADPALLAFLRECGLVPGATLRVTQVNPIDATVVVAVGSGTPTALGPATAAAVRVVREPAGPGEATRDG
jgi:DtxR family Mn-dependent transcriptional regulator